MRLWSIPVLVLCALPVGASDSVPNPPAPPKPGEACTAGHFRDFGGIGNGGNSRSPLRPR